MNKFLNFITGHASPELTQKTLTFLRVSTGLLLMTTGSLIFIGGTSNLQFIGSTMANFGIHFWPIMWGILAASTEFFGGLALVFGLATRLAAVFLSCVMIVAITFHINKGDPVSVFGFALILLVIFVSFVVMGAGKYSVDAYLHKKL